MKKSILFYGAVIVAYILISKKLKEKDSELSKSLKKCADKLSCVLNKMTQRDDAAKEQDYKDAPIFQKSSQTN